jgi:predicted house-cleaning noncanonical NTP pyrophosphatase (MazG superfamily)
MKLVRDLIASKYEAGELKDPAPGLAFRRVKDREEHILFLRLKLAEEVGEVLSAHQRADLRVELGDLIEVAYALAELSDISLGQILVARGNKRSRLGGFAEGWVLE